MLHIVLVPIVSSCAASGDGPPPSVGLAQFTETIAGTAVSFEMVPVPGDASLGIRPFWIGRTEVTWDAYDVYLYGLDQAAGEPGADAVTRPSKPYISMDRGFGHAGFPGISMSYHGAASFCEWLSVKTGRRYRLPTEQEWRFVCDRGAVENASEHAWHRGNADFKTHPVATRRPDAHGIHDMYGNAAEWCTGSDGRPVTLGGSYRDEPAGVGCVARVEPRDAWNQSDPQIPKSIWWLADAGFVGFRVVCETREHTHD